MPCRLFAESARGEEGFRPRQFFLFRSTTDGFCARPVFPMKISRVVLAAAAMTAILTGCETPAVMTPAPDVDNARTLNRVQVRDDSALYNDMTRGGAAMRSDEISQVLFNEHHMGDGIDRPEVPVSVADKNASDKSAKDSGKASAMNDSIAGKTTAKKDRSVYASQKKDKSIYENKDKSIYRK